MEEPPFHLDKVKVANNAEFVTINNRDHKTERFFSKIFVYIEGFLLIALSELAKLHSNV